MRQQTVRRKVKTELKALLLAMGIVLGAISVILLCVAFTIEASAQYHCDMAGGELTWDACIIDGVEVK